MNTPRPTIPLIPELIDIRLRTKSVRGAADDQLFRGWGIGLPSSRNW